MRYFFHIGYNGFQYHGWQRQTGFLTVQEVMEESLRNALKEPVTILGCGRTDAQVHASQYFFHLETESKWDYDLAYRLNKILPADISVFDVIPVADNAHAQFDARQRTYDYFIHTYKDPFLSSFSSLYLLKDPDLKKMKEAVMLLSKYNDYKAFCKSPDQYKHTRCAISSANLFSDKNGDKIRIQITADRFLQGMIRALAAKLLKISTGELSLDEFENLFIRNEPARNLEFAYPQGLYLSKVVYPYLDLPSRAHLFHPANQLNEYSYL
jgi:tRNA pseudouridine38-40 synthase